MSSTEEIIKIILEAQDRATDVIKQSQKALTLLFMSYLFIKEFKRLYCPITSISFVFSFKESKRTRALPPTIVIS